jgi:flagellar basal-body rod protein FlgB
MSLAKAGVEVCTLMDFTPADNITNLLQTYLDVQSRRSQVIAGNIANADTPGYVAKELDFNEYLREAAQQSSLPLSLQNQQGLSSGPHVVDRPSTVIGMDGNTVDAGQEMADLASAGGSFNFGAKMLQSRFKLLRTAIREGK